MKFKLLTLSVAAACAALATGAASATPVYPDFTVNGNAIIGGNTYDSAIVANDISGQYHESLTFDTTTTFKFSLNFTAQGFNYDDTNAALSTSYNAGQTGLGVAYGLLAIYNGSGHYSTDASGITTFTLDPGGALTLSYDKGAKATFTAPASPGGVYTINPGADTITTLAMGTGTQGSGFENCTAPNLCGAFGQTTSFNLTGPGSSFFTQPVPFYPITLQSGQIEGFPVAAGTTVVTSGTLNAVFQAVPEPTSLAVVGLALAGLGLSRRRKQGARPTGGLAA